MKYITPELIDLFVKTWNKNSKVKVSKNRINCGWCYQFAILLKRLHGRKVRLYTSYGHAWVKIGSKYYDSDNPEGVRTCKSLGCYAMDIAKRDIYQNELIRFWHYGDTGPVRLDILDNVIASYKKSMK